jgi:NADH:ubiquinone oxidoreductase subunit E
MPADSIIQITICMGSSCFSRGNGRNIEAIRSYARDSGIEPQLELVGHLCQDQCRNGPNMAVNGKMYQSINPVTAVDIVKAAAR